MAAAEPSRRLRSSFVHSLSTCFVLGFMLATEVRPVRTLTVLAEDRGSVLSTIHIRQLTATCDSSCREADAFWPPQAPQINMHTYK